MTHLVGANPTKATFTWDASNGSYEFVRLKARVDSISNPTEGLNQKRIIHFFFSNTS